MKLIIRETCVVAGGAIAERGQLYTTQAPDPKTDQEAFNLLAANRAFKIDSPEGRALIEEVGAEKKLLEEASKKKQLPPPPKS